MPNANKSSSILKCKTRSLSIYFKEISRIKLLSPDEEARFALEARNGCLDAKRSLVLSNLRFVISIAKQYQGLGLELEDLINEGNSGLVNAVETFDETKGFKLISYAVWQIRKSILDALLSSARLVRIPANKANMLHKINKKIEFLIQLLEREPTTEEIAEHLDIDVLELSGMIDLSTTDSSEFQDYFDINLLAENFTNPTFEKYDLFVHEILASELLSDKEQKTLVLFYGLNDFMPHSLEDIGKIIGCSAERVRQIRNKAVEKIKESGLREYLRDFL